MPKTADHLWHDIAESQLALRGVTSGTGFGRSVGLRIGGKIFAMLVNDELVVKLPKARVDEIAASGAGRRFDPGHGRLMKEWASVPTGLSRRWPGLVEEARTFVGGA
jgi:hypothetical protein